jgi:uncharacterized protein YjbI with pentapeptide repeats
MKSKHIITGVGMLFCLAFFNLPDAAGQDCGLVHPSKVVDCWMNKIKRRTTTDLPNAKFTNADLTRATLFTYNLSGADLSGANLSNATLTGANLTNADLRGANLTNVRLNKTNLSGADLRGANLTNVSIVSTIWTDAIVSRSTTKGIDLVDVQRLGGLIKD